MNNLLGLIGRRLVALPIMVIGVSFLVFSIISLSPADPAYSAFDETASPEALEVYRVEHGLDKPLFVQYDLYLLEMLHGDLDTCGAGTSNEVSGLVAQALPIALQLTFLGLFFAILLAFSPGVLTVIYRDHQSDQVVRVISAVSIGAPSFWPTTLLILGFIGKPSVSGVLPAFNEDPGGRFLRVLLPATALAVPVVRQMTCIVRTSMIEELNRGYVYTCLPYAPPSPRDRSS